MNQPYYCTITVLWFSFKLVIQKYSSIVLHPFLCWNWLQKLFKANLKVCLKVFYSPPYETTVWHQQPGNTNHIRRAIESFNFGGTLIDYSLKEQMPLSTKFTFKIMTDFTFDEFVINSKRMIPTFALLNRQLKKHCLVFISIKIECWIKSMFILGIISSVCKNNLLKTASPDFYDMFYKRGFPLAWKKSNVVSLHKKESKLW